MGSFSHEDSSMELDRFEIFFLFVLFLFTSIDGCVLYGDDSDGGGGDDGRGGGP